MRGRKPVTRHPGCSTSRSQTILRGEFFVARDVPVERIRVTEGKLFIANAHELAGLEPRLSPSGQAGLHTLGQASVVAVELERERQQQLHQQLDPKSQPSLPKNRA
jgi:hypothetical protein